MKFLEKTAAYLWEKFEDDLKNVCVVLPNRRGSIYLKKYLSENAGRTIFAPEIISIEDFISKISGLYISENYSLLFKLYSVYRSIEKDSPQSFEDFMKWGQTMISDFNDVDNYLCDAEYLFKYLDAAKAMSLWNPDGRELTDFQKNYIAFYRSMFKYYSDFRSVLLTRKNAYPGMAFRYTAENIEELKKNIQSGFVVFAGFNALTPAEKIIIRHLISEDKAEILWDADNYYLNNDIQEAGNSLRDYRDTWNLKEFKWISDDIATSRKKIQITGVPLNVGQAKLCGNILKNLCADGHEMDDTLVALADESMLIPVVNSIPQEVGKFNVTMGLPLNLSSLYSLFSDIFSMQETIAMLHDYRKKDNNYFKYNDVINLLKHPDIIMLTTIRSNSVSLEVADIIGQKNLIFLSYKKIKELFEEKDKHVWTLVSCLFSEWQGKTDRALDAISELLNNLRDNFIEKKEPELEKEYVFQFACLFTRIRNMLSEAEYSVNVRVLKLLFEYFSKNSTIPFLGEPLTGMQLLGILETRTLDFRNVIVLSLNDDNIPAGQNRQSFIPNDIRYEMGLPTPKDREAVYAYHFYRLIQRAENVWLLYNTEAGNLGGGTPSRFLKQIVTELPAVNPEITVEEKLLSLPVVFPKEEDKWLIHKNEDVIERLKQRAENGFSPSSLTTYLNCSLKFYFNEVLGVRESEEVSEEIEADIMGTAIHNVLEDFFKPFENKFITEKDIDVMIASVSEATFRAIKVAFKEGDIEYGRNLLTYKVSEYYVRKFLESEKILISELSKENQSLKIIALEKFLKFENNIDELTGCKIKFKGKVDRIDIAGGKVRIVDYKTGNVDKNKVNIKFWDDLYAGDGTSDIAFQLLMYAYLYCKELGYTEDLSSGVISLRKPDTGLMPVVVEGYETLSQQILDKFEALLLMTVNEIFNQELPFMRTRELNNCRYCPFSGICGRDYLINN